MLSKSQKNALESIEKLTGILGKERIFTKYEVPGVTEKTLYALYQKGYLEYLKYGIPNVCYYKLKKEKCK